MMDSGVDVSSQLDIDISCFSYSESDESQSSSLNSSVLVDDHLLETPRRIHADSFESLGEISIKNGGDDILTFKNSRALQTDLRMLLDCPEMCDVKFLVGPNGLPVYGVKAILASRSRRFRELLLTGELNDVYGHCKKKSIFSRLRLSKKRKQPEVTHNQTLVLQDLRPDDFQRFNIYLHCGALCVTPESAVGVMVAADIFGFYDIRDMCYDFAENSINEKCIWYLLESIHFYSHFRCAKLLLMTTMDFVNANAQEILLQSSFLDVTQKTAMFALSSCSLRATDETKLNAVLKWTQHQFPTTNIECRRKVMKPFLPFIDFNNIPLPKLQDSALKRIIPEGILSAAVLHQSQARFVIGHEAPETLGKYQSRRISANKIGAFLRRCSSIRRRKSPDEETFPSQ